MAMRRCPPDQMHENRESLLVAPCKFSAVIYSKAHSGTQFTACYYLPIGPGIKDLWNRPLEWRRAPKSSHAVCHSVGERSMLRVRQMRVAIDCSWPTAAGVQYAEHLRNLTARQSPLAAIIFSMTFALSSSTRCAYRLTIASVLCPSTFAISSSEQPCFAR
jgi:hypothetical protein